MNDQVENPVDEVEGAAPEAAPEKPKRVKGPEANGITMPGEGTKTRAVWDKANEISAAAGRPALSNEVHDALEGIIEKATISTQYNRWCKFYAVTKEQRREAREAMKPTPAPAEEAPADQAAAE